jgi:hypothetical protein
MEHTRSLRAQKAAVFGRASWVVDSVQIILYGSMHRVNDKIPYLDQQDALLCENPLLSGGKLVPGIWREGNRETLKACYIAGNTFSDSTTISKQPTNLIVVAGGSSAGRVVTRLLEDAIARQQLDSSVKCDLCPVKESFVSSDSIKSAQTRRDNSLNSLTL